MTMKVDLKTAKALIKKKRCDHIPRPLSSKKFVIDIEDTRHRALLVKEIEKLGGSITEELNDGDGPSPICIISDYHRVDILSKSNIKNLTEKQRNGLPSLLRSAIELNIRIQSYELFMKNLMSLKKNFKTSHQSIKAPAKNKSDLRLLNAPAFKLEMTDGRYAPAVREFSSPANFPTLYLGNYTGKSVFHHVTKEDFKTREKRHQPKSVELSQEFVVHRANLKKRGMCDVCAKHYDDLRMHCTSKDHLQRISQPGFYDEVDDLCFSSVKSINVDPYKYVNPKRESKEATKVDLDLSFEI